MATSTVTPAPEKRVSEKATALAKNVQAPTAAQVRGYFAMIGQPVKSKITGKHIAAFLVGNPTTTRALARSLGIPVGTRGRLHPNTVDVVAEALSL